MIVDFRTQISHPSIWSWNPEPIIKIWELEFLNFEVKIKYKLENFNYILEVSYKKLPCLVLRFKSLDSISIFNICRNIFIYQTEY